MELVVELKGQAPLPTRNDDGSPLVSTKAPASRVTVHKVKVAARRRGGGMAKVQSEDVGCVLLRVYGFLELMGNHALSQAHGVGTVPVRVWHVLGACHCARKLPPYKARHLKASG